MRGRKNSQSVDILSLWRATRSKNGKYDEKDGAAGLEETIQQHLEALPEEERENPEKRNEIFKSVFVHDRTGVTLCQGVLARSSSSRTSSRKRIYELELEDIRSREEESRAVIEEMKRQKEEHEAKIAQMQSEHNEQMGEMKADMERQKKVQDELLNAMRNAGFSIPGSNILAPTSRVSNNLVFNARLNSTNNDGMENGLPKIRDNLELVNSTSLGMNTSVQSAVNNGKENRLPKFGDSLELVNSTSHGMNTGVHSAANNVKENRLPKVGDNPSLVNSNSCGIDSGVPGSNILGSTSKVPNNLVLNARFNSTNNNGKENRLPKVGGNSNLVDSNSHGMKSGVHCAVNDKKEICLSKITDNLNFVNSSSQGMNLGDHSIVTDKEENHSSKNRANLDLVKSQTRRRLVERLPTLFDKLLYLYQSSKRFVLAKQMILQTICTTHGWVHDKVVEMLSHMLKLVPEWICERTTPKGVLVLGINKDADPLKIRVVLDAKAHCL